MKLVSSLPRLRGRQPTRGCASPMLVATMERAAAGLAAPMDGSSNGLAGCMTVAAKVDQAPVMPERATGYAARRPDVVPRTGAAP